MSIHPKGHILTQAAEEGKRRDSFHCTTKSKGDVVCVSNPKKPTPFHLDFQGDGYFLRTNNRYCRLKGCDTDKSPSCGYVACDLKKGEETPPTKFDVMKAEEDPSSFYLTRKSGDMTYFCSTNKGRQITCQSHDRKASLFSFSSLPSNQK